MKSLMLEAAVVLALLATTAGAQESPNATGAKDEKTVTEPEDKTGQAIDRNGGIRAHRHTP